MAKLKRTYADDSTTCTKGKTKQELIPKMEYDAGRVLAFMAANGLVANPAKTSLLVLNQKKRLEEPLKLMIGNEAVKQESSAKLLGLTFDDDLNWETQIYGKGGLITSLNSRLYLIKRLKNVLNKEALLKVVDGIFMSKVRYGLQLLGKV